MVVLTNMFNNLFSKKRTPKVEPTMVVEEAPAPVLQVGLAEESAQAEFPAAEQIAEAVPETAIPEREPVPEPEPEPEPETQTVSVLQQQRDIEGSPTKSKKMKITRKRQKHKAPFLPPSFYAIPCSRSLALRPDNRDPFSPRSSPVRFSAVTSSSAVAGFALEPRAAGGALEHEEVLEPRDVLKILEVKREMSEAESKKHKMLLASRIREGMRVRGAMTKIKSRTPGAETEDEQQQHRQQQNLNQNQKQRLQLGEAWTVRAQDEKEDDVVRDAWQTRSPRLRHTHLVVELLGEAHSKAEAETRRLHESRAVVASPSPRRPGADGEAETVTEPSLSVEAEVEPEADVGASITPRPGTAEAHLSSLDLLSLTDIEAEAEKETDTEAVAEGASTGLQYSPVRRPFYAPRGFVEFEDPAFLAPRGADLPCVPVPAHSSLLNDDDLDEIMGWGGDAQLEHEQEEGQDHSWRMTTPNNTASPARPPSFSPSGSSPLFSPIRSSPASPRVAPIERVWSSRPYDRQMLAQLSGQAWPLLRCAECVWGEVLPLALLAEAVAVAEAVVSEEREEREERARLEEAAAAAMAKEEAERKAREAKRGLAGLGNSFKSAASSLINAGRWLGALSSSQHEPEKEQEQEKEKDRGKEKKKRSKKVDVAPEAETEQEQERGRSTKQEKSKERRSKLDSSPESEEERGQSSKEKKKKSKKVDVAPEAETEQEQERGRSSKEKKKEKRSKIVDSSPEPEDERGQSVERDEASEASSTSPRRNLLDFGPDEGEGENGEDKLDALG